MVYLGNHGTQRLFIVISGRGGIRWEMFFFFLNFIRTVVSMTLRAFLCLSVCVCRPRCLCGTELHTCRQERIAVPILGIYAYLLSSRGQDRTALVVMGMLSLSITTNGYRVTALVNILRFFLAVFFYFLFFFTYSM